MMPIKGLLMRKRSNSNTIGLQKKKGKGLEDIGVVLVKGFFYHKISLLERSKIKSQEKKTKQGGKD